MAALSNKYSEQALAFWTLYKTMKPETKKEVVELIIKETDLGNEITTEMLTDISMASFQEIWDAPENDHWDDFIKNRLQCINKDM